MPVKENILLMQPPRVHVVNRRVSTYVEPHLGLAYVAAYLREKGRRVRVEDACAGQSSLADVEKLLMEEQPRVLGLTAPTVSIRDAAAVAGIAKEVSPDTATVIGGYHATAIPAGTLEEFAAFDFAVAGDGEETFFELAGALLSDGNVPEGIRGIAYRRDGKVVWDGGRDYLEDLDALPLPAWDLFDLRHYRSHYDVNKGELELPLVTSRGCPNRCVFCARATGSRVRARGIEGIRREVRRDIDEFKMKTLILMDESFTLVRRRAVEFCGMMIAEGFNERVDWLCMTRVDRVDAGLLKLMREAGCGHISFGIESGSQEVLDASLKGITLEQSRKAVARAKEAGIMVDAFFILGLPFETKRTMRETIRFAVELDSGFANFFNAVPYPGTRLREMAQGGEGGLRLRTSEWENYGIQMGSALYSDNFGVAQLKVYQLYAYLRFFLRPKKLPWLFRMLSLRAIPVYLFDLVRSFFAGRAARGA